MKKRIISFLLVAIMIVGIFPVGAMAVEGENSIPAALQNTSWKGEMSASEEAADIPFVLRIGTNSADLTYNDETTTLPFALHKEAGGDEESFTGEMLIFQQGSEDDSVTLMVSIENDAANKIGVFIGTTVYTSKTVTKFTTLRDILGKVGGTYSVGAKNPSGYGIWEEVSLSESEIRVEVWSRVSGLADDGIITKTLWNADGMTSWYVEGSTEYGEPDNNYPEDTIDVLLNSEVVILKEAATVKIDSLLGSYSVIVPAGAYYSEGLNAYFYEEEGGLTQKLLFKNAELTRIGGTEPKTLRDIIGKVEGTYYAGILEPGVSFTASISSKEFVAEFIAPDSAVKMILNNTGSRLWETESIVDGKPVYSDEDLEENSKLTLNTLLDSKIEITKEADDTTGIPEGSYLVKNDAIPLAFWDEQSGYTQKMYVRFITLPVILDRIGGTEHEHTFSDEWRNSPTHHWHKATCEHTELSKSLGEHTFGTDGKCTVCGYEKIAEEEHTHEYGDATYIWHDGLTKCTAIKTCGCGLSVVETVDAVSGEGEITATFTTEGFATQTKTVEAPAHVHTPTLVAGKAPTCTADGWKDYYQCSDSTGNKLFSDPACTSEITNLETWKTGSGKLAATGHKAVNIPEKAATTSADGYKTYWYCPVCETYYKEATCTNEITNLTEWKTGDGKIEKLTPEAPHTHTYGEATYIWNEDLSECTAYKKCSCGNAVIETVTTSIVENNHVANFSDAFTDQTKPVVTPEAPHEHTYGTATYIWNEDLSECTAYKKCSCGNAVIETVTTSIVENNHVADFSDAFTDQTKPVVTPEAPHTHTYGEATYIWNEDLTKCTAYHTCTGEDCGNIELETVNTEKEGNKITATFINTAFAKQTKTVTPPEAPHEHTFSAEWSHNATHHWHEATCDHTELTKDVGAHDFGSGKAVVGGTKYTCKTCGYEVTESGEVCSHKHLTYVNNNNGTHKVICFDCTETIEASEACVYDRNGGTKCVCGAKKPSMTDVKISVDVKAKTTKQFVGFLFWGTWKNVTTYTATIKTEATGVKVTKVQYQLNGGRWTTGTSVSSTTPIKTLNVKAWDNKGNVHEYTYTKGN